MTDILCPDGTVRHVFNVPQARVQPQAPPRVSLPVRVLNGFELVRWPIAMTLLASVWTGDNGLSVLRLLDHAMLFLFAAVMNRMMPGALFGKKAKR
jgi:hypothetical protein